MRLYLMRHGLAEAQAAWDGRDDARPLVEKGVAAVGRVAAALARTGASPGAIVSSPLLRADQTARIVGETLGAPVALDERLAGLFRVRDIPAICEPAADSDEVMLVGHEPACSMVLEQLTGARAVFRKGACARVDLSDPARGEGTLVWLLTPSLAGE